jgi:glycerophosphoryl diester phosphodiesterase
LDVGLPRDPRGNAALARSDAEERFALPYVTIETALPLADGRLLIVNDNNFPSSIGRHLGSGRPDDTEWIWLRLRP